jgi:hypothetical protein
VVTFYCKKFSDHFLVTFSLKKLSLFSAEKKKIYEHINFGLKNENRRLKLFWHLHILNFCKKRTKPFFSKDF